MTTPAFHTDPDFLARVSAGEEEAFTQLFNHFYPQIKPFVARFFSSPAETEEALQETFIRVWLNRDKLPNIDNIQAWIYTIASRQCLTRLRQDLVRRKKNENWLRLERENPGHDNPDELAILAEIKGLVGEAIRKMPVARQRIYRMSREEGLKPAQIAEALSVSVSTVKNTLVVALKEIRDHLEEKGHWLPAVLFLAFLSEASH